MWLLKALLTCCVVLGVAFAAEFTYDGQKGPANWPAISSACGQGKQSPINIYEGDVKQVDIKKLTFSGYESQEGLRMTLENNGHAVKVNLEGDAPISISGGGLPVGTFKAKQFHFHWGRNSDNGSEHLINTKAYPMELHIVHYNAAYNNISQAVNQVDGLAVLGFMYEVSNDDNANYSGIVNNLNNAVFNRGATDIPTVPLSSLLPEAYHNFYRYSGSLTTPGCYESVNWTVFTDTIKISEDQLTMFRNVLDDHNHKMANNFRPVQPLNNRIVQANFKPKISWTYNTGKIHANNWDKYYSNCGGERQSPINIVPEDSKIDTTLGSFIFHNYGSTPHSALTIKNNGHTANVYISNGDVGISEGGLPGLYQAHHVHFHWGSNDEQGSEHKINRKAFPLEVHIVHFRKSLENVLNAMVQPDGLAVIGFFAEVTETDNPALQPIIDSLTSIQSPYSNASVRPFSLGSILPQDTEDFYRYNGSLTTPGCFQSVIWTILTDTITISRSQLDALRSLRSSENDSTATYLPMKNNYRPVQDLNGRVVRRSFGETPSVKAWSYHSKGGQDNWSSNYRTCENTDTSRQSPINIQPKTVEFAKINQLRLFGYNSIDGVTMDMINNGHTAKINIKGGNIVISEGGLDGMYKAEQLHFHWGADNRRGSEHLIDDRQYAAEVHIVHHSSKYRNVLEASTYPNGLAVLAFFYEISKVDNPSYHTIIQELSEIERPHFKTSIPPITLSSILPSDMTEFYRYEGSLTVPGCNESVIWTVFKSTIKISNKQINTFRSLLSSDKDPKHNQLTRLVDNYREPQPTNNRQVKANFISHVGDSSTNLTTNASLISLLLLLLKIIS